MGWDNDCIGVGMGLGYVFGNNSSSDNRKPDTDCIGVGMGLGYVFGNHSSRNNNESEMWG